MPVKQRSDGYTHHNRIRLIHGGAPFFRELEALIGSAVRVIHIQVYIFDIDTTGRPIAEALMAAARRGVKVYLLADGFASQKIPRAFIQQMREAGIRFRYFEPLLRSTRFYFGRRLHQKTVVVDGLRALVGGVNIADRYNDVDEPAWLDYAVHLEGEAALQLHQYSEEYWKDPSIPIPPSEVTHTLHRIASRETASVRLRRNDWVKGKHQVWNTYFHLFTHARESITIIICSYFLPGHVLRAQLAKAAKRGVRVRVILAGPSDVPVAKWAERYLYDWMLKHRIRLFEYQPTVLHAKMAVVDDRRVTIGSFNINNISAYASIELNAEIRNKRFAATVKEEIETRILPHCEEITEENFATNATLFKRFLQRAAYELIRVVLNLSTFYFRHE